MEKEKEKVEELYKKLGGKYSKHVVNHYLESKTSSGVNIEDVLAMDVKKLSQSISQFKRHNGGKVEVEDVKCTLACRSFSYEELEELEKFVDTLIDEQLNMEELEEQLKEIERRKERAMKRHYK